MNLIRWDPMRDLRQFTRHLEQMAFPSTPVTGAETESLGMPWATWPNVDVYEDREEIIFRAEVPGMELKEVELMIEDSTLTLRGEHRLQREDKRENYQRIESSYGTFTRSFVLPATVDKEHVRAELRNGVLEVHVPKREGARGKTIPIKS